MISSTIYLACPVCGHETPYQQILAACPECGGTLLDARYQTDGLSDWPQVVTGRPASMWRYHELLPVHDLANVVSIGEGVTPFVKMDNVGAMLGLNNLYIKDERQQPTGSFKDRQASLAISVMREHGIQEMVVASTGNVAIAYGAYCARVGIKLWAFLTSLVPADKMREVALYGTEVVKVTGTYDHTKQIAASFAQSKGLYLDRGIRSFAALESMKTVAFEIAEQLSRLPGGDGRWRAPDWYFQSVSGGLGPVGVMKGFRELAEHGLIDSLPKLGCIQTAGCDPMVRAWKAGQEEATPINNPQTLIATLATGDPGPAYKILRDLTLEHGGEMESVSDEEAFKALHTMAKLDGLSMEPAAAVAFAGLFKLMRQGIIDPDEMVVVNCTGHTFPVEKQILGDEWERSVDVTPAARPAMPEEGLLAALAHIDKNVNRIAIIEDNPDAARLVERILHAHADYEVLHADNGHDGILLAHEAQPDLIVLDLMMPGVDGFAVLDALKGDETLQDVPVIVVTAKDLTPQERQRLGEQVESLLHKGSFIDESAVQDIIEQLG
jgi:threonine synthase